MAKLPRILLLALFIFLGSSCQDSSSADIHDEDYAVINCSSSTTDSLEIDCDTIKEYLPLDDSEYPYAGIPRIVIETENHREIKDRETEIPAKLQIWGKNAPESKIMELTIRGRGNYTWHHQPKKPFAIKFTKKQKILGMPKAKKWTLLANYRDRTLIRNALAFEIARQTDIGWTPQGRFVDLIVNRKFLGNYYVCEKIEIKKNRLNLNAESFLLELDTYYDGYQKFRSIKKNFPINIKHPDSLSKVQFSYIQNLVDSTEIALYSSPSSEIHHLIDNQSFALYWIIYELTTNTEPNHPKSVFMHKEKNTPLKLGPVWDFDWQTFVNFRKGFLLKNSLWFDALKKNKAFCQIVKEEWKNNKDKFSSLTTFIDSTANRIKASNEKNFKIWPIKINDNFAGDEEKSFQEAIEILKKNYLHRIEELDSLFLTL